MNKSNLKAKQPLVSIIIPAYNEENHIADCLRTLLNQTYKETEIIAVDDGSSDKTVQKITEYPVELLSQSHQGPAKARNKAAKMAKGRILVFVDSDMTFEENFIKDLVQPIIDGQYKGTFSKEEYISNWDNVWSRCWNINLGFPDQRMIPGDYPDEGLDFRAIIKDEFLRVGGFDDVGYTDTWTLHKKLGYRPHAVSGAKYYHANPQSLGEVFNQAKWVAKREYKYGRLGMVFTLLKSFLPISLLIGVVKATRNNEYNFITFKIIYDIGIFTGLVEKIAFKKLSK